LFTYLAHPDLPKYLGPDDIYCKHMRRIVEKAVELKIPLEINMYGFSDGRHYPCDRFFKMPKELKPKVVLGCDAHIPELIRQPESAPGLSAFLAKHGIEYGDNVIDIVNPNL
ncbi:MAG: histidinol phosphate phosphatase, partial [Clostridiales bacterium]|nr:histidinol phosphate phosphatase [Clostridiales bacterium]